MNKLKPKLFSVMKTYDKKQFFKDVIAGIIVAIIALPLSIALAIASGVGPEQGLYTAIFAGFFISFLGGSRVQIGGPTAAFVVIVYGIVVEHGMAGLTVATLLAGIILILMGFCKFGSLIKYIPYTITTGFTAGIAVGIFAGQIKDFLGLDMGAVPSEFIEKIEAYSHHITTADRDTIIVGAISLIILIIMPKISKVIPGSLVAIIIATLIVKFSPLEAATIGSVYGELSSSIPAPSLPDGISFAMIKDLLPSAFTIAILAGIESLLSCVVSDGMINSRHRSNMELIGQGVGNIASGLFGGIPATGAIARTAANVKNGGRTPIAGMVHALVLLLILKILMPYAAMIPMTTLAAILIVVAFNMGDWKEFGSLCKHAPKSDVSVLIVTFVLTVIFDLVVAIEVGIVLASLLFIKRMSDVSSVRNWTYIQGYDDNRENDPMYIGLKEVPEHTLVYEIDGPMFFGVADNFMSISVTTDVKVVILRMRSVPAMDITALHSLEKVFAKCVDNDVTLVFSHVNEQPMKMMEKAGFVEKVGKQNFRENIDAALEWAAGLV